MRRKAGAIRSLSKIGWLAALLSCAAVMPAVGAETARVETVRFADPRLPQVRVVRGAAEAGAAGVPARPRTGASAVRTEIVSFGSGRAATVTVVRGVKAATQATTVLPPRARVETVRFSDPRLPQVAVVRGVGALRGLVLLRGAGRLAAAELFGAADAGELDRIAFAVDGVESGHGANLAMWRPEPDGPQGPMQVSAAAAVDVGGGDRFDMRQNRLLGRAYLARLYGRYGNWPDAVAAYNWGPGNLDSWIVAGRPLDRLPLETARYLERVLRDAFMIGRL